MVTMPPETAALNAAKVKGMTLLTPEELAKKK